MIGVASAAVLQPSLVLAANRKLVFKIKTKSGGIIGNILIEAKDTFAAIAKLKKRYPGCEVLEVREKRSNLSFVSGRISSPSNALSGKCSGR